MVFVLTNLTTDTISIIVPLPIPLEFSIFNSTLHKAIDKKFVQFPNYFNFTYHYKLPTMKPTILLADDTPAILRALEEILTLENYNVLICENGLDAMNILKQHQDEIHLFITDVKMPKIDGVELIQRMPSFLRTPMAVIIISGFYDVRSETLKLGTGENVLLYDAFLKPIDLKPFLKSIEEAVALTMKRRDSRTVIDKNIYLSYN